MIELRKTFFRLGRPIVSQQERDNRIARGWCSTPWRRLWGPSVSHQKVLVLTGSVGPVVQSVLVLSGIGRVGGHVHASVARIKWTEGWVVKGKVEVVLRWIQFRTQELIGRLEQRTRWKLRWEGPVRWKIVGGWVGRQGAATWRVMRRLLVHLLL